MAKIIRKPALAAKNYYDLIIIGGGIYGALLSLHASLLGLRSLLIERDDFGEHTSFNSLRIIHGGLRYLQTLDFRRFFESVGERRWFLKSFPNLVRPLPCLMPLYGKGLRRPFVLNIGLLVNNILSYNRNLGVHPDRFLPPGRMIDPAKIKEIFPSVDMGGLQGGAIWYDAWMPDSQRLLIEILCCSCEYGAISLNYIEASKLLQNKGAVKGILAIDRINGECYEYSANAVVNASGPWCRNVAAGFDRDEPNLFKNLIVWNILFDRKALSDYALAVTPKKPGGHTYFLLPWKGKLLAGTGQAAWFGSVENPMPSVEMIQEFLDDINFAVPNLELGQDDILRVFPGLQPAAKIGSDFLATREVILNHAHRGGPLGLYTISGVKFTTARLVAEKTLKQIFPKRRSPKNLGSTYHDVLKKIHKEREAFDLVCHPASRQSKLKDTLQSLILEEAVQHLDDLIFRRTTLWENPKKAMEIASVVCADLCWDDSRCREEMSRLREKLLVRELS